MELIFLTALVILLGMIATTGIEKRMSEVQDSVDALVVQLAKVHAEVVNAGAVLLARIDELEAQVPPEVDLGPLRDAVKALDDLNPDAVVEPPVE